MKKINFIFTLLFVMLLSFTFVSASITTPTNYNFFTDVGHRLGLFTAEGQTRSCDINVRTGNEITVQAGKTLSTTTLSAKCSGSFLIDTFDTSYHFLNEYRSEIIGDGMTAGANGIWQIYCCPYHACTSNSGCSSSPASNYGNLCNVNYGSCYSTTPTYSTSILKCVNNAWVSQGTASYGQTHFCSSSGQTDYIDSSNSEHCANTPDASWCASTACSDTCSSLGYTSGNYTICGVSTNCGNINTQCSDESNPASCRDQNGCAWNVGFLGIGAKCEGNLNVTGTLVNLKKLSLTRDQISKDTNDDLFASSCLSSSECLTTTNTEGYTVSCVKIASLRADGTLTQVGSDSFFENSNKILNGALTGAGIGLGLGVVACVGGSVMTATGVLAEVGVPVAAIGCPALLSGGTAIGGAIAGASLANAIKPSDSLVKALKAKDADSVGICVAEDNSSSVLNKYFSWASLIPIVQDKGVNGLINILIFLVILGFFFKK